MIVIFTIEDKSCRTAEQCAMQRLGNGRLLLVLQFICTWTQQTSAMAVRPKLEKCRAAGGLLRPPCEPPLATPGPRDVILKVYDISTPALLTGIGLLCQKTLYWFPKLTVAVGPRTWSYDGEVERTVDEIVEAAAGPPLRTFNLGPTVLSDREIDELILEMGSTDYAVDEYDFFFRNCNHFCDDFSQRLNGDVPGSGVDREFMIDAILGESEGALCNMIGFQENLTRKATRQIQKVAIVEWRKSWKRALAEYDEEQARAKQSS